MMAYLSDFLKLLEKNVIISGYIILCLFIIHLINYVLFRYRLNQWISILPRNKKGIIGIIFAPIIHNSWGHFVNNIIPLFILINLAMFGGIPQFIFITIVFIISQGILVWIFARKGYHLGASGLIMSYIGYFIVFGFINPNVQTIIIGIICIYYFGSSLIANLFKVGKLVSIEGHLFGFIIGVLLAMYIHHYGFPNIIFIKGIKEPVIVI
ncbi:MAG: rhomboid family intramembrane serine protease [Phycisphaerales bacterium]|nr:rhomboid family intramembrane serine protease [Phycisphaerales bacterium]